MRSLLIPVGVAIVGLLAGAAVAGRPTSVPGDIALRDVPPAALTTTTLPATTTTTAPPIAVPVPP